MPELSTTELLDAWERGIAVPAIERTLSLMSAADPHSSLDAHASLPLGERNARLLGLRRWAFGSRFEGVARCSRCGAELELTLDADELLAGSADAGDSAGGGMSLRVDGYEIHLRLPDSRDEREASQAGDVDTARRILLQRCVTNASRDDSPIDPLELPEAVVTRIEDAMERGDPHADLRFALECTDCGHAWEAPFDVGQFVWGEVDRWARRTLVDVAALASAFGWTEDRVLALSPLRRQAYLEIVGR
jgi:hypothetical protein